MNGIYPSETSPGFSAPMPAIPAPRRRTRSIGANLAKGQTGLSVAFDLPTQTGYDSDHSSPAARSARSACRSPISATCGALFDGIPLDKMNTSMTINAAGGLAARALCRGRRRTGRPRAKLTGTTQNDIIKEYLSRGTYIFPPAPALRLTTDMIAVQRARHAEMESDQCLLLSFAGSRRDAGAGAGLRAGHGRGRAGRGEDAGEVRRRNSRKSLAQCQLLRQFRRAIHHRNLQAARVRRSLGRDPPRTLRRHRSEAPPVPLWRAGQFARPDRAAAREQRLSHPVWHAGRDAVEERARPRRATSGLERGARPAAPLGPAMVAAPAADRRLRDRPARLRRHLRRLEGDRRQGRGAEGKRRAPRLPLSTRWAAPSRRSNT